MPLHRLTAGLMAILLLAMPVQLRAQGTGPGYAPAQLDQLLAPIALYPDQLLTQILIASTYPLEVVEASRWLQDPVNAGLRGDQLEAALDPLDWDPSVKSLVPFPEILRMMDSRLDWMQQLGDAFLSQQADVMDAVQRLRAEAQAAGTLQSSPQQTVLTQGQTIVILPANPQFVYVPAYNPLTVYGPWPYPGYPPFYFPPPWGYAGPQIVFGIGFGIVGFFWGWCEPDWHHHRVHVDAHRYNHIDDYDIKHRARPPFQGDSWNHDPYHRRGVPYRDPGLRAQFQPNPAGPPDARRDFRGYDYGRPPSPAQKDHRGNPPAPAPQPLKHPPITNGPLPPPQATGRPPGSTTLHTPPPTQRQTYAPFGSGGGQYQKPQEPPRAPTPWAATPRATINRPPAFEGINRAPDTRAQSARGEASRHSMQPPPAGKPGWSAPPGGNVILQPKKH
jgi:hypothetical protein